MDSKKKSPLKRIIPVILVLLFLTVLFCTRLDRMQNKMAMKKGPVEYFGYLGEKQLRGFSELFRLGYRQKAAQLQEHGELYQAKEIQIKAEAMALLRVFFDVSEMATQLSGTATLIRQAGTVTLSGSILYGETVYPLEYEKSNGQSSVNELPIAKVTEEKKREAVFLEYGQMVLEQLKQELQDAASGNYAELSEEDVRYEVGDCAVTGRQLHIVLSKETLQRTMHLICDRMLASSEKKADYEAANFSEETYAEYVEGLRQTLLEQVTVTELTLCMDEAGKIRGCVVAFPEKQFLLEGCLILERGVIRGSAKGCVPWEDKTQEFTLDLADISLIQLLSDEKKGEICLMFTKGPVEDTGLSLIFETNGEEEKLSGSLIYGGAVQLEAELLMKEKK